jgi:hypothetical protein
MSDEDLDGLLPLWLRSNWKRVRRSRRFNNQQAAENLGDWTGYLKIIIPTEGMWSYKLQLIRYWKSQDKLTFKREKTVQFGRATKAQ